MKSKRFAFLMIAAIILILGVFGLLHQLDVLSLPSKLFTLMIIIISSLFFIGGLIMFNAFTKEPDVFVNRFMILTTFQFLAVLAILGAVWYKLPHNLRAFGFQFIGLFVALMFLQSIIILRVNK